MSQPLYWPGQYYFYPIGNTPAVSLTRDLSPDKPANILLLGCGDPRNVLFTLYNEDINNNRRLDFTCNDIDPAIIARNVILFTMLIDGKIASTTMWRIFFDTKLDRESYSTLVEHCKKLFQCSSTQEEWSRSPYGSLLKFSTLYTLKEARRHWKLYIDMENLPHPKHAAISDAFSSQMQENIRALGGGMFLTFARSAGPLLSDAIRLSDEHFKHYHTTGVTSIDSNVVASATLVNPTFAYSLGGEGYNVQRGTSPLLPFHFAAVFGNSKRVCTLSVIVQAAQEQFRLWCDAYCACARSSSPVTVRFLTGEATAVSRAFQVLHASKVVQTSIPIAQWQASMIEFDSAQYSSSGQAPTSFNVIETSNMVDHVGLLNVLLSVIPLRSPEGVIYTESLLFKAEDATKEFADSLYADLSMIALLLGIVPIDYLSGFFSRSNAHEIILQKGLKGKTGQFHQVTTWKSPASLGISAISPSMTFDVLQLGTFLWDMYHRMFEEEDAATFFRKNSTNMKSMLEMSSIVHYNRESFVLLLKLVRSRLALSTDDWGLVMERFFDVQDQDTTMPMDTVNRQDLHSLMFRHNVFTVPTYRDPLPRTGIFSEWPTVPQVVRVVLTVPRSVLADVFTGPKVGTPTLQCDVRGKWSMNTFSAIQVVFGRATSAGTASSPRVALEQDREGWGGRSPLVVSFTMPTHLLINIEPQEHLHVTLSIRCGVTGVLYTQKLGNNLVVFRARLLDREHVQVIPEHSASPSIRTGPGTARVSTSAQIGRCEPVKVILDDECELATHFLARIHVENTEVIHTFRTLRANPEVTQLSPCSIGMAVSGNKQEVFFPFPVIGAKHRLRVARQSLYIEAVPLSGPFQSGGMKIRPFPVLITDFPQSDVQAWNMHYLNLSRLPVLSCDRPKQLFKWLNPHLGCMMSTRERQTRKQRETDSLMFLKDSLHSIMVRSSGIQGGKVQRLFALRDKATNNCDTFLFVSDLRYDIGSHTIVCDAFVLPLTPELLDKCGRPFSRLIASGQGQHITLMEGEMISWKHLLPAFVERCRTWGHRVNCEYKAQGRIPLTEEMDVNPICSCGAGKNVEGMSKMPLWHPFAPHVTRIALSPLFGVSYLESIGRDINARRCWLCRGKGKPKLQECSQCRKVRYCGPVCQRKDWAVHKLKCTKGA